MKSSTRQFAIEALGDILPGGRGGGKPKAVLDALSSGLVPRDRAFLMEIVYGVLRHRDTIDLILSWLMKKPDGVSQKTVNNLRAGIYQIYYMRVPEWAAVNESVSMEKKYRPLVNAVLRNAIRSREDHEAKLREMRSAIASLDESGAAESIATLTSHPLWLIKRWQQRLGTDETLSLAEAGNVIPPLTLRVNTLSTMRDELIEKLRAKGHPCEPTAISPHGIRLAGTVPFRQLEVRSEALVQDEAAQLVSLVLAPKEGERVLDACAAPGGKTAHIASLMKGQGNVVAIDSDPARLEVLKENMESLGIKNVTAISADLMDYALEEGEQGFDAVLLDAPCSALGVIRRNPDIKYRRREGDLVKYSETQFELIKAASGLLKKDGRLVYAVCSTEPDEGEHVVERLLKSSAELDIIDVSSVVPAALLTEAGFMRTWPHRDGMDGFFAAALRKVR